MRVVLHIGTDKAGSTAIQHHLNANRDWLAERGVYLPLTGLGPDNGHADLFEAGAPAADGALAQELREARDAGSRVAILCWEGLHTWGWLQARRLRWLAEEFPTTLLVYLREQAEVIQSAYLQTIRRNISLFPMDVFEERPLALLQPRYRSARYPRARNYERLLRRWESALRPASIDARRYDPATWQGGDLLADFLSVLELEPDVAFTALTGPLNISLDAESAAWLESRKRAGATPAELRRLADLAISRLAQEGPGSRFFLDRATVERIRSYYSGSNDRWYTRYGQGQGEVFPNQTPCWCEDPTVWRSGAVAVGRRLQELDAVPTHEGPALRGIAVGPLLASGTGWGALESWGCWSEGERSLLRFRLFREHIMPFHEHLTLYLCGRREAEADSSLLRVNGHELGDFSLGHGEAGIELPLAWLGEFESMEIELFHRQGGYGIESIGYDLVSHDS